MNNQGEVTERWADGTYTFRLTVKQILELEQKCSAPFGEVFSRVVQARFGVADITETLRLGLIGGGTKPAEASILVERYAIPFADNLEVCRAILSGAMFGFEASPLGEEQAAAGESPNVSTPQPSQEPLSSLESVLSSLERSASGNFAPL